jgi:hypothetical protein
MSPADLATLSLLDPDQGNCPAGHPCSVDEHRLGWRRCAGREFRGMALICWDATQVDIDAAEQAGADRQTCSWARGSVSDRDVSL